MVISGHLFLHTAGVRYHLSAANVCFWPIADIPFALPMSAFESKADIDGLSAFSAGTAAARTLVCYGSKVEVKTLHFDVRLTPESGH